MEPHRGGRRLMGVTRLAESQVTGPPRRGLDAAAVVLLAAATALWAAVFSQLLLTGDLPRIVRAAPGRLSAAGHLVGAALLTGQAVLLVPRRTGSWRRVAIGAGLVALAMVGAEVVQALRPVRAWEASDVLFDLAGVALGGLLTLPVGRSAVALRRARLSAALATVGVVAVTLLAAMV